MARLVINSLAELKQFQIRIKNLIAVFPFIQTNAILDVTQDDILEEMKKKMQLNDFSQKIIDATFVGPIDVTPGKIQVHYISNYESEDGFDVSDAREEGTEDHEVKPKKKGGTLRWIGKNNEVIFRKKSHPSGIERLLIIERTIQENQGSVTQEYGQNLADEASNILGV